MIQLWGESPDEHGGSWGQLEICLWRTSRHRWLLSFLQDRRPNGNWILNVELYRVSR